MIRLLLSVFVLFTGVAHAGDSPLKVTADTAWARATPPGSTTTAIYLSLENHGTQVMELVSASSDISERIELHTHKMEEGVMKMLQVKTITVPAGENAHLKPHGDHIMVFNLTDSLAEGQHVNVTLRFENDQNLTLAVPVLKESPVADENHMQHGDKHSKKENHNSH